MTARVIFFGSIPVARECLELVLQHPDADVVGVCAVPLEDTWRSEESVFDFCQAKGLPLVDHDDLPALAPDLGLSVRYHRILRPETIALFDWGVVNVHGGLLPEYRGSYCNIHAIINDEPEFGVTLHHIIAGVDTGDVVARKCVTVEPDDTGMDLYRKGERLCVEMIREQLDPLMQGTAQSVTQDELIARGATAHEYKRADLDSLREIPFAELDSARSLRVIRAFDSPHHEPASTVIGGRKVYLRTSY